MYRGGFNINGILKIKVESKKKAIEGKLVCVQGVTGKIPKQ